MSSPLRTRLSIALAAFAVATVSLPAMAQTWIQPGPLDTPDFLESWAEGSQVAPANAAEPEEASPIRVKNQRKDPEAPSESVEVASTPEDESERPKPRRLPAIIDQYPQNPRCYVAGQYVPAPPLCPN